MTVLARIDTAKVAVPRIVARKADRRTPLDEAVRDDRMGFIHAGVLSVFLSASVLAGSIFLEQINDRVVIHKEVATLFILFSIVITILIIVSIVDKLRSMILERISTNIYLKTAQSLFRYYHTKNGSFQDEREFGSYNADLDTIKDFINGRSLSALYDSIAIPIYVYVCFMLHRYVGVVVLVGLVLLLILTYAQGWMKASHDDHLRRASLDNKYKLVDILKSTEVINTLGMRDTFEGRIRGTYMDVLEQSATHEAAGMAIDIASKFLMTSYMGLIITMGLYLAIEGEIGPGTVIGCMLLSGKVVQPFTVVTGDWPAFLRARQAHSRLQDFFRSADGGRHDGGTLRDVPSGEIGAEGLAVAAPGTSRPILSGVSFSLAAGQAMGVIGPGGAGKSALVRALVGIWPPAQGSVRLDGADLHRWDANHLGQHVGYLPQTVELLPGTIAENIARFGDDDDEAVIEAARLARVHEVLEGLPKGYETQVGEGGSALTAGQRQRVGLARALYGRPAIVVLDEPDSNLDSPGEAALAEALGAIKERGITCILASQKAGLLRSVDVTLVLKEGTVAAFGPRDEIKPDAHGYPWTPTIYADA